MVVQPLPTGSLGITEEIWEGRGLAAKMREFYAPDVIVRTPGGLRIGEPAATRETMEMLHAFPDRELLGEDVIWCGDPATGILSSHRVLSTATHRGDGPFGPPTRRRLRFRTISDCFSQGGKICDAWRVCDSGAILRQIGQDPQEWAAARIEGGAAETPLTPARDRGGPYDGQGNDEPTGARLADLLARLMEAEFSVVPAEYDRACALSYPGGVETQGQAAADRFWLPLRAAFPAAVFAIHHVIGREDPLMPPRAAVRWSLTGPHEGWGPFGAPSGAQVHVMGVTHAEFGPRGLRREWTLYDEGAVWIQVLNGRP